MALFITNKSNRMWYNYHMNKVFSKEKILGKWNLIVDTPFGKEEYTLNIDQDQGNLIGHVQHEKGFVEVMQPIFSNGTLACLIETDFPIKSSVLIKADLIEDNVMSGSLQVDEYLFTSFVGEKYVPI